MRWSGSIAAGSLAACAALALAAPRDISASQAVEAANSSASGVADQGLQGRGGAAATDSYARYVQPAYGTGGAATATAVNPLTKGEPLRSLKGDALGTATFMSPKSKPLLTVTVMPNFSTGDLAAIAIHQDLDADGTIDYSVNVGGGGRMVSALCGNGVVLCAPGTFSGCEFRRWEVVQTGEIVAVDRSSDGVPFNADDLFNCYCFNSYCSRYNNSSALNTPRLVQDAAGTIAAVLMQGRPDMAIASVSASETSISYYGTRVVDASSVPGISAPRSPGRDYTNLPVLSANSPDDAVAYYPDAGGLDAMAETENSAMAGVPGSLFSIVGNTQKSGGSEILKCSIRREASLNSRTLTRATELPPVQHKARKHVKTRIVGYGGERFMIDMTDATPERGCGDNTTDILPPYSDPGSLGTSLTLMEASCLIRETLGADSSTTVSMVMPPFSGLAASEWQTVSGLSLSAENCGTVHVACTMKGSYIIESYTDGVSDGCSALQADPACKLREELVDGRPHVTNFVPTGFSLAEVCRDLSGAAGLHRICRAWWRRERTYVCDRPGRAESFDSYLEALRPSVKEIQGEARAVEADFSPCEKACRVRVPTSDTMLRRDRVDSDLKQQESVAASGFDYFVKTCSMKGGVDACPVDAAAGETVADECRCLDGFGEAAAAMQALKQAADDAVCSGAPPVR